MTRTEKIFLFIVFIFLAIISLKNVFSYSLDYKNSSVTTNCTIQAGGYTLNNTNDGNFHYNDVFQDCLSFYPVSSPCSLSYTLNTSYLISNYSFILAGDGSGSSYTNYWNVTNSSNNRIGFGNYTATGSDLFNVTYTLNTVTNKINIDLYQIPVAFFICEWIVLGEYYNYGAGVTPSLQLYSNWINSTISNDNNYIFSFNGTSVNNSNNYNCNFLIDGNINQTKNNTLLNLNQNFSFDITGEKWYNFSIQCDNENATNTLYSFYFIDTITPNIITTLINNSEIYDDETLNYTVQFQDTNLYAFNHTILKDSNLIRNDFIQDINTTTYNLTVINKTLAIGLYSVNMSVWDSHTNNKITKTTRLENNIFYFSGITFYCDNLKNFNYEIKKDRIIFKLKFNKKQNQNCYMTGNKFIKITNTIYNNHYVDFVNGVWIDDNLASVYNEGNKLNFIYENTEEIITDSIGELNYISIQYFFTVIERPTLSDILLNDINNSLHESNELTKNINEGLNMIAYIILLVSLIIVCLIIGISSSYKWFVCLSGLFSIVLSIFYIYDSLKATVYNNFLFDKLLFWFFLFLGISFIILGFILSIFNYYGIDLGKKEKKNFYKKDFYDRY